MSSAKQQEENVKKLVALGFSKTKAQKALKDSGNNYQRAKEMLDRLQQQSEKEQQQQELIRKKQEEEAERKAKGVLEKKSDTDVFLDDAQAVCSHSPEKRAERRHPCIVQYKSCRYGKNCLLKDLPGDVCINHFNSNCIYGSACRNRHSVNGMDTRHYIPLPYGPDPNAEEGGMFRREDGGVVLPQEYFGGGVQVAEVAYPDGVGPASRTTAAMPPEYEWNAVRGSEATSSDPLVKDNGSANPWAVEVVADAPTPFLDKLLSHPMVGGHQQVRQVVHSVEPVTETRRPVRYGEQGFMAHPCILQCGGCKYGDQCLHATRPADVCVFFLNGRCNYEGSQCRYRHEDIHTMQPAPSMSSVHSANRSSVQRLQSPAMQSSSSTPGGGGSTTSPSMGFVLRPNAVVGGVSMWSLNESIATREQTALERQYAPPAALSKHGALFAGNAFNSSTSKVELPTRTPTLGIQYGGGVPPPGNNNGSPSSSSSSPSSPCSPEEERRAFNALRDVFPQVEPGLLLHCLRMAGGDRNRVGDFLASTHAADDTKTLVAILEAESKHEESQSWHAVRCSSDTLLSLCSVFPNLDVPILEDALSRSGGDAAEAFRMLVCSTEHLSSVASPANRWSGTALSSTNAAADQLKLQRLTAMFPELSEDVIRDCFAAANNSAQTCIESLTQLTSDLRHFDERMEAGNRAMRGDCLPNSMEPTVARSSGVDSGSFTVSSDADRREGGFSVVGSSSHPLPSQTDLYHEVAQETLLHSDWRRTREEAYFVNRCRIQLLSMAAACYAQGNGLAAKQLSQKASALGAQYRRLNMIAMRVLEEERTCEGSAVTVLDLHGFHVDEAIDILHRRIQLCLAKRLPRLRVVIGSGTHSLRGKSTVFPAVLQDLTANANIARLCRVVSVKQALIEVRILLDG